MNLTSPTALFWFFLAIPIVIFYLLKIRLRRVPVSTVMFWNQIYEEKKPRSIWQQLRHLLSLLLQLLFLTLLAFALTDPLFFWETTQKRRLIVLLDTSASMQATDVEEGSRLTEAKRDIRQLIRTLRSRDDMALITLGATSEVVSGLTSHHRTLHEALDSVLPTDQPTQYKEAFTLAQSLIQDHPNGEILLLTDGGIDNFEKFKSTSNVQTKLYGKENTPNAGITQFQIRRNLIDPIGYEVLVEVINHSNVELETRLELELDTEIVDVIPLKLKPEEKWSQVLNYTAESGGVLKAQLNKDDALISDNQAFAILSDLKPIPVYLVSSGSLYLQQVFNAIPLVDLQVVTQQPEKLPPEAVLVFHRTAPKKLPAGNVLVIEPQNSTDHWTLKDKLKSPLIANQDRESQLMAHVRLDNVVLANANNFELHQEAERLATTVEEAPIYFSFESSKQKVVVLNANLDEGDLPLRTAFPILMSNALNWFSGSQTEFLESLASGTVTSLDIAALKLDEEVTNTVPETTTESDDDSQTKPQSERVTNQLTPINLTSPNQTVQKLVAQNNKLLLGPLNQVGVWNIESGQKPNKKSSEGEQSPPENPTTAPDVEKREQKSTQIACNLSNSRESNLRVPRTKDDDNSFKQAGFSFSPIWFYLILLATIFTCVEWYLYQRRWID